MLHFSCLIPLPPSCRGHINTYSPKDHNFFTAKPVDKPGVFFLKASKTVAYSETDFENFDPSDSEE
jgi:hypothetical protein